MTRPITDDELDSMLALVKRQPGKIESMSPAERRAYDAEKARESRLRARQQLSAGNVPHDTKHTRQALSDAALMILASGAPGSFEIRRVLEMIFADKPGVPMSLEQKIKAGKLRPILLKPSA